MNLPPNYMLAKLQMVMPLLQEARDALTALSEVQRKLHSISPTLAQRMDEAGTYDLAKWLESNKMPPELRAENLRLAGEVASRNARALEGDKSKAAFDALYAEHERLRAALDYIAEADSGGELYPVCKNDDGTYLFKRGKGVTFLEAVEDMMRKDPA